VLIAQQPDLSEQPRAIAAAFRPALQQVRFLRRQHTAPGAPGLLPFGRTPEGKVAVDCAPRSANDLGDIEDSEPGRPERPDLLVPLHLAGVLLLTGSFDPLLPGDQISLGRVGQWAKDRVAHPCCLLEGWSEAEQAPLQRLDQVLEQAPTSGPGGDVFGL
jgi:hypothetical protein